MPKIILIVVNDDGDVQVHHLNNDTPIDPKLDEALEFSTDSKDSATFQSFERFLKKCKEIDQRNKNK